MNKPIIVDLYCGAGGATKGYQQAGFYVIGVDINPQPNYCGDLFIQMDALEFMADLATGFFMHNDGELLRLRDIAAFHGSPPCQANTALTKGNRGRAGWLDTHVDLIPETRDFFEWFGLPYVIENTQGATMRRDLVVCGYKHFGLRMFRHRYFELGGGFTMPRLYCNGSSAPGGDHFGQRVAGVRHGITYEGNMLAIYGDGGGKGSFAEWAEAMGIDWVTVGTVKERKRSLAEAIPPVYAQLVGWALMAHIRPIREKFIDILLGTSEGARR
jgi:hypothetical protein